jgi:hypothetical protein
MQSNPKSIVRSAVLAAGLLGTGAAFADEYSGSSDRSYDRDGDGDSDYGQVRSVQRCRVNDAPRYTEPHYEDRVDGNRVQLRIGVNTVVP